MLKTAFAAAILVALGAYADASDYVPGHYRSNGTYVTPYYRSGRDTSYNNNWTVRPNVNPYTGRQGSLSPTWNDRAPTYSRPYGGYEASTRSWSSPSYRLGR
jgi:hypothetical protein